MGLTNYIRDGKKENETVFEVVSAYLPDCSGLWEISISKGSATDKAKYGLII